MLREAPSARPGEQTRSPEGRTPGSPAGGDTDRRHLSCVVAPDSGKHSSWMVARRAGPLAPGAL